LHKVAKQYACNIGFDKRLIYASFLDAGFPERGECDLVLEVGVLKPQLAELAQVIKIVAGAGEGLQFRGEFFGRAVLPLQQFNGV